MRDLHGNLLWLRQESLSGYRSLHEVLFSAQLDRHIGRGTLREVQGVSSRHLQIGRWELSVRNGAESCLSWISIPADLAFFRCVTLTSSSKNRWIPGFLRHCFSFVLFNFKVSKITYEIMCKLSILLKEKGFDTCSNSYFLRSFSVAKNKQNLHQP